MSLQPTAPQTNGNPILVVALLALACGISLVPTAEDGTKRPFGPWKQFQERLPTEADICSWYPRRRGIGFITGAVSGGLELFEFDDHQTYLDFRERAAEADLGPLLDRVESGYLEETPAGGIHLLYRVSELRGNTKLASRPGPIDPKTGRPTVEVLIETRGEGGFVVVWPSGGPVHPSGKPYILRRGGVETIAKIADEERNQLWDLARSFDQMPKAAVELQRPRAPSPSGATRVRPGDDFGAQTSWADILTPAGWVLDSFKGDEGFWIRPGKTRGNSATTNYAGTDRFYVFSTSTEFQAGRSYDKFTVYTRLYHGGDFKAAAKALAEKGYGKQNRTQKRGAATSVPAPTRCVGIVARVAGALRRRKGVVHVR